MSESEIQRLFHQQKILLIDKPEGMTSHDVVNRVRRLKGEKRVGHAGTLDPLATGLLIILVGREATRLQDVFMHQQKCYEFTAQLGVETDTYDREGAIVRELPWSQVERVTESDVLGALALFRGEITQAVPAYSAVKQQGKKLYELARKGIEIDLPTRQVTVYELELTAFQQDHEARCTTFSCRVTCGAGTYVRSLAVDIGRSLGVGAMVTVLRRTAIGEYYVSDATKMGELTQSAPFLTKKNHL